MKRAITQILTLLLLITLAVPAFAGKVLAEIEYFYSDDGTLTGKAFNGKRVNFEYDLRGQLLAVKDASGKDLESYTYDPAGNRLSKTINGVTTTYTYDKATLDKYYIYILQENRIKTVTTAHFVHKFCSGIKKAESPTGASRIKKISKKN